MTIQLIPVLDLLGGQVVRGVAGRREQYRPVVSRLCDDARPASVAAALVGKLGLDEAYVADLDAIGGAEPAWETYREIASRGLSLWIDAGLRSARQAEALAQFETGAAPIRGVVAGLETMGGRCQLAAALEAVGSERLVFSLDLKQGCPLHASADFADLPPVEIAAEAIQMGSRRLIVLDLARVGTGQGVGTEPVCRAIRRLAPHVQLVAGGGVRSEEDLRLLEEAGCDAALVASALHDGRITATAARAFRERP